MVILSGISQVFTGSLRVSHGELKPGLLLNRCYINTEATNDYATQVSA